MMERFNFTGKFFITWCIMKIDDIMFMLRAISASKFSQCVSVNVGAVLRNGNGRVFVGANNTVDPSHRCTDQCNHLLDDNGKLSEEKRPEHSQWSDRNEVHAEMRVIMLAASHEQIKDATLYTTHSPCSQCAKNIEFCVATGMIKRVVYLHKYDRGGIEWIWRLQQYGAEVVQLDPEEMNKHFRIK